MDVNNTCLKLYDELLTFSSTLINDDPNVESFVQSCMDFETNWNIPIGISHVPIKSHENLLNIFETLKPKIMRTTKKCVVFGRTSSGKSTLINALLTENVLPSQFGETSNCFVEIRGAERNYLIVNDEERHIDEILNLNNSLSNDCLPNGSTIKLFYDKSKCELLNEDIIFMDTPGLDTNILLDEAINEHCQDADVIILVVNSISGFGNTEKNVLSKYRDLFANLNIMIVYNFWDTVQPKDSDNKIQHQFTTNAKRLLVDELNYSDERANKNIFFISAEERLNSFTNDIIENSDVNWDNRNDNFASFLDCLQTIIVENSSIRRYGYLKTLYSTLLSVLNVCQDSLIQIKIKSKSQLKDKLIKVLNNWENINGTINTIISKIFSEGYEELLNKGLEELKLEIKPQNRNNYTNLNAISENDELIQRLEILMKNWVKECLKKLETELIALVSNEDEISILRKTFFKNLYFPFYLDLTKQINEFNINDFRTNLHEINRKIKIGTGVTIGATAATAAIGLATGGLAFAVIGLAEATIAVGCLIVGGGAMAGTALGAGSSFGAIKAIKRPFQFAWKDEELKIRTMWNNFENILSNSYETSVEELLSNIDQLIFPIQEKQIRIQNNLNAIKEELEIFKNYL